MGSLPAAAGPVGAADSFAAVQRPAVVVLAVSTSGNDSTCVRGDLSKRCATFNRAYQLAQCGDLIEVAGGTYATQTVVENAALNSCANPVTFQPAAGATVTVNTHIKLGSCQGCYSSDGPSNVTFKGMSYTLGFDIWGDSRNVILDGMNGGGFSIQGPSNVTIRNSDFGPCNSSGPGFCYRTFILGEAGDPTVTTNLLVENNVFHDYVITGVNDHQECLFTQGGGTNVTIRGNRFYNCDTYAIATGARAGVDYVNWKIENNWFGDTCCFGGLRGSGGTSRNSAVWINVNEDILVRFNSFAPGQAVVTEGGSGFTNVRVVGNILGAKACVSGVSYAYNLTLGGGCSASDRVVAQLPYLNPAADGSGDYHLVAGSAAEGLVSATGADEALAIDKDGDLRSAIKDAGSDER